MFLRHGRIRYAGEDDNTSWHNITKNSKDDKQTRTTTLDHKHRPGGGWTWTWVYVRPISSRTLRGASASCPRETEEVVNSGMVLGCALVNGYGNG